jgi:hypothetical protein
MSLQAFLDERCLISGLMDELTQLRRLARQDGGSDKAVLGRLDAADIEYRLLLDAFQRPDALDAERLHQILIRRTRLALLGSSHATGGHDASGDADALDRSA